MEISSFIEDFESLPKSIQHQLIEYAEFLIAKSKRNRKSKKVRNSFTFSWENGLSELKDQFTSVELRHKINEIR